MDPRFRRKWKRTLYFPLFMQEFVVPRLARILTVSNASAVEIERYFRVPEKEISVVYNGTDSQVFRPLDRPKETDLIFIGRTEDRKKGVPYLLDALARTPEHVTLKIVDGRIPDDGLVPRKLRELGLEKRVVLCSGCSRSKSSSSSTPRRGSRSSRRSSRASASPRRRPWRADCR
jgi:glycosyltransferase involved in cell wall biosynthesis